MIGVPDAGSPGNIDPALEPDHPPARSTTDANSAAEGQRRAGGSVHDRSGHVDNVTYYYRYWCSYWAYYYPCYPYYPPVVGVDVYTVRDAARRHGGDKHASDPAQRRLGCGDPRGIRAGARRRTRFASSMASSQAFSVAVSGAPMNHRSSSSSRGVAARAWRNGGGYPAPTLIGASYQLSVPIGGDGRLHVAGELARRGARHDDLDPARPWRWASPSGGMSSSTTRTRPSTSRARGHLGEPGPHAQRLADAGRRARWFPAISSNRDIRPYIGANIGGYHRALSQGVGLTAFVGTTTSASHRRLASCSSSASGSSSSTPGTTWRVCCRRSPLPAVPRLQPRLRAWEYGR